MTILSAFNNHMIEFIDDIINVFPNDKEINKGAMAIKTLIKINPKKCLVAWKECILKPYENEIKIGNVDFFIAKDYKTDVEGGEYECVLESIDRLRQPIRDMGEENQQKALQYIKNLSKISSMY
jgi:hypothetical protein